MNVWDWNFAASIIPSLLDGLLVTLEATALGSLLAFVLGLMLALLRYSPLFVVSKAAWGFIEVVRSTPLLVQLYIWFFLLAQWGITLGSMTAGVLGLGVHYATYTAEVYRAGIDAVPRGQWEAARALNLPRGRTWVGIVLPQAIPRMIPALGNYVVSMFKETPLLLTIGVLDILGQARGAGAEAYRFIEPYTLAGILFLALSYPSSILIRRLERRVLQH
ncbi:ectoine/hydroxyectoine ABC transporter permease subunit EhuD [Sinomonas humi]|uniref:Amino acid ABC transporter permease n=1 Tax=Sinomonas humi TaxID=1338436 RepID=A0A0B2ALR3_9MICC|nr:ectoine/hydroxyectoine ABC transporter permease subunit EhuD [Sinomonas humi]KHL04550.1 amino acid ABC transporter permease [Sinomonas humi]